MTLSGYLPKNTHPPSHSNEWIFLRMIVCLTYKAKKEIWYVNYINMNWKRFDQKRERRIDNNHKVPLTLRELFFDFLFHSDGRRRIMWRKDGSREEGEISLSASTRFIKCAQSTSDKFRIWLGEFETHIGTCSIKYQMHFHTDVILLLEVV